ncbi:IS200/IS605 family accessory protein TnpB-related protein [Streptomyces sp. NPDC097610]|uniref:IS200/IS605 family accessory protein TnpB-related protein n=1 Tax=Streptomyces sp. NPDC097610 TaxID=3157227 RepID=UPI0033269739
MTGANGGERVAGGVLRTLAAPFVAPVPVGVAVRTRLKGLSGADVRVLGEVGRHLGALAGRDLTARCAAGVGHDAAAWAVRKRELSVVSSSRWAGSITKASHDQWALARRCLATHIRDLEAGITVLRGRLALPLGQKGARKQPGGYRSRREWHAKSRRLKVLQERLAAARADWAAGRVRIVRGGRKLANTRHHLQAARLDEAEWRGRWESARMFLTADGESGKRFGNETIRLTPDGELIIRLPAPLAHLANAPHDRYRLTARAVFAHRGHEWADRIAANRAVAYRIHHDSVRDRWYVTASWQRAQPATPPVSLEALLAAGITVVGVDTNDDHYAAWRLDEHGNPIGEPQRFFYDLSGNAAHRDAQMRHATSRLLHFAGRCGARAIAIEDLDFHTSTSREQHGRRKRFRRLISRFPTARLAARLVSMAATQDLVIIAVDPAYTSRWGAQHWQRPMCPPTRKNTRHDAASIVIGRRAQGFGARRRTAPPPYDRSDRVGHRTAQAAPRTSGREGNRPPRKGPPPGVVSPPGTRTRQPSPPNTVRGRRSEQEWIHDSLPLTT